MIQNVNVYFVIFKTIQHSKELMWTRSLYNMEESHLKSIWHWNHVNSHFSFREIMSWWILMILWSLCCHDDRPTNVTSIEFEIWSKFSVLWFKVCSTNHNKILYMSRQWTVVTYAQFCCDRLNMLWTRALQSFIEFRFRLKWSFMGRVPGICKNL